MLRERERERESGYTIFNSLASTFKPSTFNLPLSLSFSSSLPLLSLPHGIDIPGFPRSSSQQSGSVPPLASLHGYCTGSVKWAFCTLYSVAIHLRPQFITLSALPPYSTPPLPTSTFLFLHTDCERLSPTVDVLCLEVSIRQGFIHWMHSGRYVKWKSACG